MKRNVAVIGIGQTKYMTRRMDVSEPELAFEAVVRALEFASIELSEIDAVIFGLAPDAFEGVNLSEKWCAGAVGAVNKPYMRVNTGGATGTSALETGFYHVASGYCEMVLVVCLQRVKESTDTQKIFNTIWDPIYEKDIALNTISMISVQATRQMEKYGLTEEQMAMVAVKNRKNGLKNPYAHIQKEVSLEEVLKSQVLCWPIKLLEACPSSDGACAVILASEERARKVTDTPAWILGIANCADTYYMGDRMGHWDYDFVDLAAESIAAQRAYRMADISNPRTQIDVAEIYAPFSNTEIVGCEAIGLCQRGEGGRFIEKGISEMTGELPVNPSGGVQVANPIAATALIRAAEAALQVMGKAGDHQIPGAEISVCTGAGGSSQFYTVVVFGNRFDEGSIWG